MKYFSTFRPEYLPSLEYFWKIVQCDFVVITEHLQYTKRSPISISAPLNEPASILRIPVSHKPLLEPIYLKRVDDHSNWRKRHFKTLQHIFHQYPYGYYYLPLLEKTYKTASPYLSEFLYRLLQQVVQLLHLDLELYQSGKIDVPIEPHSFIKNWQDKSSGAKYLISYEALEKEWLNQDDLNQIRIQYDYFSGYPEFHILKTYKDKSVINFLMQFGPEAGYILRQYL